MRVLVLSDYYPPAYVGGYEVVCKTVTDGLRARGHEVLVLTARREPLSDERHVRQVLTSCDTNSNPPGVSLPGRAILERVEAARVERLARAFRPDVCYIWNGRGLLRSTLAAAGSVAPVVPHLADYWYLDHFNLRSDHWHGGWAGHAATPPRRVLATVARALRGPAGLVWPFRLLPRSLRHGVFVSRYVREHYARHIPDAAEGAVIYNTPPEAPSAEPPVARTFRSDEVRLLLSGRVVPEKGAADLLDALPYVASELGPQVKIALTVAGPLLDPAYEAQLRNRVRALGTEYEVRFVGMVDRSTMTDLYQAHQVLCFPATWPEPFSVAILEAMSAGLPVVATRVGGNPEIVVDGENGRLVPPASPQALGQAIASVVKDAETLDRMSACASGTIREHYSPAHLVDQVERHLQQVARPRGR